ncbi:acyl-CoA reductase [Sediminicola luteus]|uniref:Acyl-CoA reductase n=1 Tax=Sediminicola luteus TaxID=319238 RepID=A0A2A4G8V6_9FLAO|nr:acyl-CoA reductase [Sediminicola luteus]PCE64185.1 acyl-CoA reductase [Sediminicola luteus]
MSELIAKINSLSALGSLFNDYVAQTPKNNESDAWLPQLAAAVTLSEHQNGWFTPENVNFALASWGQLLQKENLSHWLEKYPEPKAEAKTVAIIMAGNIPLVGFHDLLCVLLAGHKALIKRSSSDMALLNFCVGFLKDSSEAFADSINFVDGKLEGYDAVIATGSDNTSRYFEYYFGKKPHIIRKNRNSVAVLTGTETPEELQALAHDVFHYYGLGCRSVSKLFIPEGFDTDRLFQAFFDYQHVLKHEKYTNNYDYNKAVYLMSEFKFLENGFLMLKEDPAYASPIGSLFYETYSDLDSLTERLTLDAEKLQCIVGKDLKMDTVAFGQTQCPSLSEYADGVDTMAFLHEL